jgi:uncharacterized protein (TIGR02246 family)
MRHYILIAAGVVFMGACATLRGAEAGTPPAAREDEQIKATVGALMEKLSRTAETFAAEKALAVLSDDADAVFFFDSKPCSKRQLIDTLTTIYATLQSMKINMDKPTITVLGPDAAVWAATGTATSVSKAGETFVETLNETWVWQRRNGAWRVVHSHESVAAPAATPAAGGK